MSNVVRVFTVFVATPYEPDGTDLETADKALDSYTEGVLTRHFESGGTLLGFEVTSHNHVADEEDPYTGEPRCKTCRRQGHKNLPDTD